MRLMFTVALVLFVAAFAVLFLNLMRNKKRRKIGLIIGIIICILLMIGIRYVTKTMSMITVGNEVYKTDDMVVAVRDADPAQTLEDCASYTFGYKEEDNSGTAMIEDINSVLGSQIQLKGYKTEVDVARALIEGEIGAAIYNQAYSSVLSQVVNGFEGNVRIVHHYGYRTDFEETQIASGESFNILISGIDVYGDISQTSRSDVNIIMTVNPRSKRIIMTSTPRDCR